MKPNAIPTNMPPTAPQKPPCYADVLKVRPNRQSIADAITMWYQKVEEEFTHLRGNAAMLGDRFCGRGKAVQYQWQHADQGTSDSHAGSTKLSSAWRAVSAWCITLAKPRPASHKVAEARVTAATTAIASVMDSLALDLGDTQDALDFQAFILQLTPNAMATQACMAHAAKAAAKIALRLEQQRIRAITTSWRASLTRGKVLTRAAYNSAKAAVGFDSSPTGIVNE